MSFARIIQKRDLILGASFNPQFASKQRIEAQPKVKHGIKETRTWIHVKQMN